VVRVEWSGSPDERGMYQFILLDDRVSPAQPVGGYSATWPGGSTGPNWAGSYQALATHYPWLEGTADRISARGWSIEHDALGLSATAQGEAVLSYGLDRGTLPTSSPEQDLALAVVYVASDGEVRWAKRVPLDPLA
jgi:hypothetical protein